MVKCDNNDTRYELVATAPPDARIESPLRMLRRVLRGRFVPTIALALILGAAGAVAGYTFVRPTYESSGLVHVRGAVPAILYQTPETQAPPMFDTYVASVAKSIESPRVLEAAIASPEMQALNWPQGAKGLAALQSSISVRHGKREELIQVFGSGSSPERAQATIDAVLTAFVAEAAKPELSVEQLDEALTTRAAELEQQLADLRERSLTVSDQFGAAAIRSMHASKVDELVAIESKIAGLELARSRMAVGDTINPNMIVSAAPSIDSRVERLRTEELEILSEIRAKSEHYGPGHPMMRELSRRLESVRIQIEMRTSGAVAMNSPTSPSESPEERLNRLEAQYISARDTLRAEAAVLARKKSELAGIDERINEVRDRLAETRARMDKLQVESRRGDLERITVAAWGTLPVAPTGDRRKGLASAGALGGLVLGVAIVFLSGLRDRRIRYLDELEALPIGDPLIGLVPEIEGTGESRTNAMRAVHQLRNLLELQTTDPSRNVYAITSGGRGDGKTSLALGLATSFAAAGRRTLIIDADLTQRRLTTELGLNGLKGLCESIGPVDGEGQVHRTSQDELWAMPVGAAGGMTAEDLSRTRLIHLLDVLRDRFEAIVIDTGPIRSSIEACLVSAVADRVVMVCARNQTSDRLRTALDRLAQVGARCAGIVFNRALAADIANRNEDVLDQADLGIAPLARTVTGAPTMAEPEIATEPEDALPFRLEDSPPAAQSRRTRRTAAPIKRAA